MTPVELKEALHNGGPVFGTLIVSPSPFWPKVLGDSGLDFVFIDTEHIALDRSQVSWMCRTYKAMGLPPFVRIVSPSPYEATMVLDDGAAGVVALEQRSHGGALLFHGGEIRRGQPRSRADQAEMRASLPAPWRRVALKAPASRAPSA